MIDRLAHRELFVAGQANFTYLQDGDVVVAIDDGTTGLGTQRTVVRYAR